MFKTRVITSLARVGDTELVQYVASVLDKMDGNTYFPVVTPPVPDVRAQLTLFREALNRLPGTKEQTALKNAEKTTLKNLTVTFSRDVQQQANRLNGTYVAALDSTGLRLTVAPVHYHDLDSPTGLAVEPKGRHRLLVTWDAVPGARNYLVRWTAAPETEESRWEVTSITRVKLEIDGLTSGQRYAVQVAAVGSDGKFTYSDSVYSYVM